MTTQSDMLGNHAVYLTHHIISNIYFIITHLLHQMAYNNSTSVNSHTKVEDSSTWKTIIVTIVNAFPKIHGPLPLTTPTVWHLCSIPDTCHMMICHNQYKHPCCDPQKQQSQNKLASSPRYCVQLSDLESIPIYPHTNSILKTQIPNTYSNNQFPIQISVLHQPKTNQ